MALGIKKPQLNPRPLKHLRVMPLLVLDEGLAAWVNRDRQHLRFRQAQGVDDVAVLLPQRMAEDAQRLVVTEQLLVAERQIVRTANGLELVRTRPFVDEQWHVVEGL